MCEHVQVVKQWEDSTWYVDLHAIAWDEGDSPSVGVLLYAVGPCPDRATAIRQMEEYIDGAY